MPTGRADLADFSYFLAITRHGNFRRAALELGVSPSALSHSLRGLEERLGVRLLNRTNRSVTLTAAGEQLRDAIAEPFDRIDRASDLLNRFRDEPTGRIRLNVIGDAAILLLAPVMAGFVERYPDIEVDIVASNRLVDIVAEGFDAGIRHGGTVPEDMIAQTLSPPLRWVVAGAPVYLDRFGTPETPDDFDVAVPSTITVDDSRPMLEMALNGTGLMFGPEPIFIDHVAAGTLRLVLADWATTGPGYQIYYPGRRQLPTGLRLLIDCIREAKPIGSHRV